MITSFIIFIVSLAFVLWGIAYYDRPMFDETWYVPAARALLQTGTVLRPEHPPLAQLLIAAGIRLFGDDSLGWRAMSAIFGSLTLVAMFFWSFALLRSLAQSLWVTVITFFDQCLYVQARIATLDIFLMAFCTLALAFFTFSLKEKRPDRSFRFAILMGISLGLAAACKWSGLFLLAGIAAVAVLFGVLRCWRARFEEPKPTDFLAADVWTWLTPWKALLALALVPWLAYTATYIPQMLHAGSILEFLTAPYRMFNLLDHAHKAHPYASRWFEWPLMARPIWYLFELGDPSSPWSAANPAQAVVALVNPVVLAAGEIAIVFAAARWVAAREINAMIVTIGFLSQYLPWVADPRSIEFFYYYFPAVLCLGPALGLLLFRRSGGRLTWPALALLAAAGLCFAYFMPVLAAQIGVSPHGYDSRIWFSSWR
jgi:dolichyl-phosphate-mannose--protein O-mannosyl transferase